MKPFPLLLALAISAALAPAVAAQTVGPVLDVATSGFPFDSKVDGETQGIDIYANDSFLQVGDHWYFVAEAPTTGRELYRTDGTVAGTVLVADVNPGVGDANPEWLTENAGLVWFAADDGVHGRELWKSDGTAGGTSLVADVQAGPAGSAPPTGSWPKSRDGRLYFVADDGVHGPEPWVSDGTSVGTTLLADVRTGPFGSLFAFPTFAESPAGDALLFAANDGVNGSELWSTDGTPGGTGLFFDVAPGPDSSAPGSLIPFDGRLVFAADDFVHGDEPWVTDGTAAGTSLLADIRPGPDGSAPYFGSHAELGGELYFSADDGVSGNEPWKTDGTAAGTVLAADVHPTGG